MNNKFIGLEDEITLRRAVRAAYRAEGMIGVYTAMGEAARGLEIIAEVAQELLDEEVKNNNEK